jgi:glycerol dehydrogenase
MLKCRPTKTAVALAKLCADSLYSSGVKSIQDMKNGNLSQDFETVVEANTLLSGLGFESGGLAAAHGVASALTIIPSIEHNFMHGEMVAMGLMTMLALENDEIELERVAKFFAQVGLPNNFDQLTLDLENQRDIESIANMALQQWFTHNEPFEVNLENLISAMKRGHLAGKKIEKEYGKSAFDFLHAKK